MVMDVEGTDGRERGEDQDFERKSALFSLASSEVLIVNMWEHQVGLYQGANMSLLKTVFEVNLGLFGKKSIEGCVVSCHVGSAWLIDCMCIVAGLSCFSLFETISAQRLSRTWKPPSQPTSTGYGPVSRSQTT